ncbi:M23 family metallopeptidase [Fodinicurvata sediminis]|uniref:M23 family metallopeptidase n=1 Tax=Fodinicurvata sediminis TaxID=1121832 RepID=UPI00138AAFCB|nr:M23 family metallopeptidase [Fodinicurvata sediminis]
MSEAVDGSFYEVQEGDTLFSISNETETRLTELVDLNELEPPYQLSPGQRLRLPERPRQLERQQQVETQEEVTEEQASSLDREADEASPDTSEREDELARSESEAPDMSQPDSSDIPVAAETGPISDPPALTGQGFSWPLKGEILSRYGAQGDGRHNDGINIAASEGTVVHASENGVVAYAGNELRGFGNLLLVRHHDGWVTAYGHNSRLLVGRGAEVKRGQPIAEVGNSGSVSRPQLHFEIRKGTRAMDPLELLDE